MKPQPPTDDACRPTTRVQVLPGDPGSAHAQAEGRSMALRHWGLPDQPACLDFDLVHGDAVRVQWTAPLLRIHQATGAKLSDLFERALENVNRGRGSVVTPRS